MTVPLCFTDVNVMFAIVLNEAVALPKQ